MCQRSQWEIESSFVQSNISPTFQGGDQVTSQGGQSQNVDKVNKLTQLKKGD